MTLIKCPSCLEKQPNAAIFCNQCGESLLKKLDEASSAPEVDVYEYPSPEKICEALSASSISGMVVIPNIPAAMSELAKEQWPLFDDEKILGIYNPARYQSFSRGIVFTTTGICFKNDSELATPATGGITWEFIATHENWETNFLRDLIRLNKGILELHVETGMANEIIALLREISGRSQQTTNPAQNSDIDQEPTPSLPWYDTWWLWFWLLLFWPVGLIGGYYRYKRLMPRERRNIKYLIGGVLVLAVVAATLEGGEKYEQASWQTVSKSRAEQICEDAFSSKRRSGEVDFGYTQQIVTTSYDKGLRSGKEWYVSIEHTAKMFSGASYIFSCDIYPNGRYTYRNTYETYYK
jgi:hypothetical protein